KEQPRFSAASLAKGARSLGGRGQRRIVRLPRQEQEGRALLGALEAREEIVAGTEHVAGEGGRVERRDCQRPLLRKRNHGRNCPITHRLPPGAALTTPRPPLISMPIS